MSIQSYHLFRDLLSSRQTTCVQETRKFLKRIASNEDLNAFLEVYEEEATEQAGIVDEKIQKGNAGRLAGMILGIKDNICYKGHICSAGSRILEGFKSLYTSTALQRLIDEDAIIIGRLNCDEFAMGSSNENSAFGPVRNAQDPQKVPGGSSGGSAVAVQAGLCHATLGSDTGGSVRQPASFCGVYGFKPTYGRVSRYGLIAYASSFDQIAPITSSIEDAALIMEVMAGKDELDATSSSAKVEAYESGLSEQTSEGPVSVALLEDTMNMEGIDPLISKQINAIQDRVAPANVNVSLASFPYFDLVVPTYQILSNAEASSNLSRYAGLLYGHQSEQAEDTETALLYSRSEGFGPEVQRRVMLGTFVLNAGYYEAYYEKAQKVRRIIHDRLEALLKEHDCIMLPTTPTTAFEIGKNINDPIAMYLEDVFTLPASLGGHPAVSIPWGKDGNGMPYGIQLIGRKFEEARLMKYAKQLASNSNL